MRKRLTLSNYRQTEQIIWITFEILCDKHLASTATYEVSVFPHNLFLHNTGSCTNFRKCLLLYCLKHEHSYATMRNIGRKIDTYRCRNWLQA